MPNFLSSTQIKQKRVCPTSMPKGMSNPFFNTFGVDNNPGVNPFLKRYLNGFLNT
jgi:hypothetical protein